MKREDGSASIVVAAIVAMVVVLSLGAADVARVLAAAGRLCLRGRGRGGRPPG